MSNINKLLVALLVLQLIIIAWLYKPGSKATPTMVSLFDNIVAEQIAKLSITDDKQQHVTLNKKGDKWFLSNPEGFPANKEKTESFVKKLLALKSSQLVARTTSSHNRLKVDDDNFSKRIDLSDSNGNTRTVFLGSSPNYKTVHARKSGNDDVYTLTLSAWEAASDAQSWRQNDYIKVSSDDLTEVSLTNSHGEFTLSKTESGAWTATDVNQPLSEFDAKEFINDISQISLADFGPENKNIDKPIATLHLKTKEEEITLKVAEKDGEKDNYLIKSSVSPFYVFAAEYEMKSLLDTKLADLTSGENNS